MSLPNLPDLSTESEDESTLLDDACDEECCALCRADLRVPTAGGSAPRESFLALSSEESDKARFLDVDGS